MNSPVKKVYITQKFGVNKSSYIVYGLEGHNGLDLRAFNPDGTRCYEGGKSEVFSPHNGVVIENIYDKSYGNYIKIENNDEGSVLAHFSCKSLLMVGDEVKMGEFIGYQGSTGNSTGIHLHWGYYKKPRDKKNGYNGYINQEGLYQPYGDNSMGVLPVNYDDIIHNSGQWEDVCKSLELGEAKSAQASDVINKIGGLKSRITVLEGEVGNNQGELKNKEEQVSRIETKLLTAQQSLNLVTDQLNQYQKLYDEAMKAKGAKEIELGVANKTIETLKGQATNGVTTITVMEFIKLLFAQKITISNKG